MAVIVVALIVLFGVLSPNGAFFRVSNLSTITLNVAVTMLLAVGITFILAAGELDLSIGSNVVLSSVVAAKVLVAVSGTHDQVSAGEYPDLALGIVAGTIAAVLAGTLFGAGQRPAGDPAPDQLLHRDARHAWGSAPASPMSSATASTSPTSRASCRRASASRSCSASCPIR